MKVLIKHRLVFFALAVAAAPVFTAGAQAPSAASGVALTANADRSCELSNGLVSVKISSKGDVTYLSSGGNEIIRTRSGEKGYFSYVTDNVSYSELKATSMEVVKNTADMVEVRYTTKAHPLNFSIGYIMRKGISGIYNYMTVKCTSSSDNGLHEARMCWRVNADDLCYAYVDDSRQGKMPTPEQMKNYVSSPQDATYVLADGTTYTKYDWANYIFNDSIHGIMTDKPSANFGVWFVNPSYEWINSGATKQELTVHQTDTSPVLLAMFQSNHFGSVATKWNTGDEMLYGPYLLYVNSGTRDAMVADVKRQAVAEKHSWPYSWFDNSLYTTERSTVSGRISLPSGFRTKHMLVVLAKPGVKPHLQGGHRQFWTLTDDNGRFTIPAVVPGEYAVYARAVDGDVTGRLETAAINIPSADIDLGDISWNPTCHGNIIWQIGESDGTTRGFKWSDKPRTYGLWKETPEQLTFDADTDLPNDKWYYAQGRNGTWTIMYDLDRKPDTPLYLTIATAGGAGDAKMNVKSNGTSVMNFKIKNDGSVYRSAMLGGCDSLFTCEIPVKYLRKGRNELTLNLWNIGASGLGGIMYDCIKLESGSDIGLSVQSNIPADNGTDTADMLYTLQGHPVKTPVRNRIYVSKGCKIIHR